MSMSLPLCVPVALRPVASMDAEAMQEFVVGLGAASRRWRFHGNVNACTPGLLRQLTQVDGRRHVAFVACAGDRIVGEARYVVGPEGDEAEFAIAVADAFRGQGVGGALLAALTDAARCAGIARLYGDVLPDNDRMAAFMSCQGFTIDPSRWDDAGADAVRWQRTMATTSRGPTRDRLAAWRMRVLPQLLSRFAGRVAAH
jgi:GNAT superfamily N-acetyltransferase